MARFIGCVRGNRGETSRLGSANSGLHVTAASWAGAINVSLYVDGEGKDRFIVEIAPWQGSKIEREILAEGFFEAYKPLPPEPTK